MRVDEDKTSQIYRASVAGETPDLVSKALDTEVAEKVMGFQWFHCVAGTGVERNQFCSKDQAETWRGVGWKLTTISSPPPQSEFNDSSGCPKYSSNIAAAMEVVEKMRGLGFSVFLEGEHPKIWECEFSGRPNGVAWAAPTLPEAICRAALATVNEPAK